MANLITLGVSMQPEFDEVLIDVDVGVDVVAVKAAGIDKGIAVDDEIKLLSIGILECISPVMTMTSLKFESSMVKPSSGSRMEGVRQD